jgi:hypothetical protein
MLRVRLVADPGVPLLATFRQHEFALVVRRARVTS